MKVTVAVCTLDRRALLARTAPAVLAACAHRPDTTLLFVDNGSADGSADLLRALTRDVAAAEVLEEQTKGLSHARNAALRRADGEWVAFLDDDAVPEPGWLDALLEATDTATSPVAVAGRVVLVAEDAPATELRVGGRVRALLSGLDLGPRPRALADDEAPVGANMLLRRDVALAVGGFSERLGRRGGSLLSMEEIDMCGRMRAATGASILWAPYATVRHLVPTDRLRRSYLLRRAYWQGRSERRLTTADAGLPRGAVRSTLAALRHVVRAAGGPTTGFDNLLDAAYEAGRSREAMAGSGRRP